MARKRPAKKRATKKGRASTRRPLSALDEAKRIAAWVIVYVTGRKYKLTAKWVRKPRKGVNGIARAGASWRRPVFPNTRALAKGFPVENTKDHLANVRVKIVVGSNEPYWTSLHAMTPQWDNIPGDLRRDLKDLQNRYVPDTGGSNEEEEREFNLGIIGVSIQVSSAGKRRDAKSKGDRGIHRGPRRIRRSR